MTEILKHHLCNCPQWQVKERHPHWSFGGVIVLQSGVILLYYDYGLLGHFLLREVYVATTFIVTWFKPAFSISFLFILHFSGFILSACFSSTSLVFRSSFKSGIWSLCAQFGIHFIQEKFTLKIILFLICQLVWWIISTSSFNSINYLASIYNERWSLSYSVCCHPF